MKRNIRKELFESKVIPVLKKSGIDVFEYNPGSFRMISNETQVDYHPRKGRLFYHDSQEWDTCRETTESLIELLSLTFDIKKLV